MNRPRPHGTHPEVSQLINDAQETAITELVAAGHAADTPENRAELARRIRSAILHQVTLGWWARHGAAEREDMEWLVVGTEQGNELIGENRIKITYDFSRTTIPALLVAAVPRRGN